MMSIASTLRHAGRVGFVMICSLVLASCAQPELQSSARETQAMPRVEADGTIHVPAFELPESSFLSAESRAALKQWREVYGPEWAAAVLKVCPPMEGAANAQMPAIRQCEADVFYKTTFYKSVRDRYEVSITPQKIGGVYTEVFTPAEGIAPKNAQRVLINVHGGGFYTHARTASHLESIPIASVGKIKVISIDYRMAPEYTFPAASEDVAAVYRELLKTYQPGNIGLYGCSAGAALTAQAMAWFQRNNLPLPGAIGMFCYGASRTLKPGSDSSYIVGALSGWDGARGPNVTFNYFSGIDLSNPLVSPGRYDEVMAKFPPSLLISGTRDFVLSAVLVTHAQLVRLGVEADLHVWEGMSHNFHFDPALPESREAYDVIVKFFDSRLGK